MGVYKNQLIQEIENDMFNVDFEMHHNEMQQYLTEIRKKSFLWKINSFILWLNSFSKKEQK